MLEPALVEAAPRPLAVVRVTTRLARWPAEFRKSLDLVYEAVRSGHIAQTGHNVMVYRPRSDGLVDIECGIDTAGKFDPIGKVVFSETPAGKAVTAPHIGPYSELGRTHGAVAAFARGRGYPLTGICWEIYGDWNNDPAELRTDIFHLVG